MKNLIDSERTPRIRNPKSVPVSERFDVMSGLDEYMEEEREVISVCPPTLPTGESPRREW
jgi:hypothetical protein